MKRLLVGLVAVSTLAGVLAGCGAGHRAAAPLVPVTGTLPPVTTVPSTTVATLPPVTTTTIDTSRVPAQIAVPYVDAVLRVLDHLQGDGIRATVLAHNFTDATRRDFAEVFASSLRNTEILELLQAIQKEYSGFRQPPGDLIITVQRLVSVTSNCIFAKVHTDYSALTTVKAPPPIAEFLALKAVPAVDSTSNNPTGWIIFFDRVTNSETPIPDQCQ